MFWHSKLHKSSYQFYWANRMQFKTIYGLEMQLVRMSANIVGGLKGTLKISSKNVTFIIRVTVITYSIISYLQNKTANLSNLLKGFSINPVLSFSFYSVADEPSNIKYTVVHQKKEVSSEAPWIIIQDQAQMLKYKDSQWLIHFCFSISQHDPFIKSFSLVKSPVQFIVQLLFCFFIAHISWKISTKLYNLNLGKPTAGKVHYNSHGNYNYRQYCLPLSGDSPALLQSKFNQKTTKSTNGKPDSLCNFFVKK